MTNNDFYLSKLPTQDTSEIHSRNFANATVMFSGGADSTVALWWALDHYKDVKVFIVDYNQPHSIEVAKAISIAKLAGVKYQVIKIQFPKTFWGLENKLTRGQACLMTSIAALDISHDGTDIVMGILRNDYYGDCNRDFQDKLADVLFHYQDVGKIGISTPLRAVESKTDVLALGYQLGAPVSLSWSCRDPQKNETCGKCFSCSERERSIKELTEKYGLDNDIYATWQTVFASPYHPVLKDTDNRLHVIANALIQSGGFKKGKPVWVYSSPDGERRVSTHFSKKPTRKISGSILPAISAHGYFDDMYRWEFCVFKDGTYAATDRIPDHEVLMKELNANAEL